MLEDQGVWGRREFLKATGALVIGIRATAQVSGVTAERGTVSGPPDAAEIDSYLAIHPDNTATIYSGYVELGQGGPTALRQIAAEELDLDFEQVMMVRNDTFVTTNGFTAASRTAGIGGTELRAAAAEARRSLLTLSAGRLNAPIEELTVNRGVVSIKSDSGPLRHIWRTVGRQSLPSSV